MARPRAASRRLGPRGDAHGGNGDRPAARLPPRPWRLQRAARAPRGADPPDAPSPATCARDGDRRGAGQKREQGASVGPKAEGTPLLGSARTVQGDGGGEGQRPRASTRTRALLSSDSGEPRRGGGGAAPTACSQSANGARAGGGFPPGTLHAAAGETQPGLRWQLFFFFAC